MDDQLVETWEIHDRIHPYLIDALPEEAMETSLTPKHRTVFQQFAHIHNVRLMWLKSAAPELLAGVAKIELKSGDRETLKSALAASGAAVSELVRKSVASGGKVKGFKPHVTAFVGYLISHESHHRGQIGWTLKSANLLDKKTAFGLWEWGVR